MRNVSLRQAGDCVDDPSFGSLRFLDVVRVEAVFIRQGSSRACMWAFELAHSFSSSTTGVPIDYLLVCFAAHRLRHHQPGADGTCTAQSYA
jgi:hypothetical protein